MLSPHNIKILNLLTISAFNVKDSHPILVYFTEDTRTSMSPCIC